jgi:ATP-binding cassette subfamily B multidrug efflux pump
MFRRFSSLVDPFQSYDQKTPPENAWRFLADNLWPFRYVTALSLMLTVIGAVIEVWLIGYASELVDVLAATSPDLFWENHGHQLLIAGAIVLVARPLAGLLKESLDDIAFRPNAEYLVRWRAASRPRSAISARPVPALPIVSSTRCPSSLFTSQARSG